MISGGSRSRWTFKPFLHQSGKLPFNLTQFEKSLADTFWQDGKKYARITVLDSFENKNQAIPSDPAMVQWRQVFDISLSDYSLRNWVQTVLFWSKPQYEEARLSPIVSLSNDMTFHRLFNIDSLLAAGYQFKPVVRQSTEAPTLIKLQVGDTMPSIRLVDLHGDTLFIRKGITKGLLLLDFWYRGCGPCVMSMPILERIHQQYKYRGVQVYGVNGHDRDAAGLSTFLADRAVTYPTVQDPERKLSKSLNIKAYPTLVFIDRSTNKILNIEIGCQPDLEMRISLLLKQLELE